jgi:hypothetical protein
LLHRLRHCGGQLRRRSASQLADAPCLGAPFGFGLHTGALQRGRVGGGVERALFGLPGCQQRRQFRRRATVAPRQRQPGRQPFVEFGEPLRVGFDLSDRLPGRQFPVE